MKPFLDKVVITITAQGLKYTVNGQTEHMDITLGEVEMAQIPVGVEYLLKSAIEIHREEIRKLRAEYHEAQRAKHRKRK